MCLVTAFFEPRTTTSPRSGPVGSMTHASAMAPSVGSGCARRATLKMLHSKRNIMKYPVKHGVRAVLVAGGRLSWRSGG